MTVKITDNQISLAVRDLLSLNPRTSGTLTSFPLPRRGMLGKDAQTRVQNRKQRKFGIFHREYSISRVLHWHDYDFNIQGRIDGVYEIENRVEIEEIKSVILTTREFNNLHIEKYPEFSEQVLFYSYLMFLEKNYQEIQPYINLYNLVDDRERIFPVQFIPSAVETLLFNRLEMIRQRIEQERETVQTRKELLARLDFPLPEERPQQQQMISKIDECLKQQKHVMISAPTGTGKTAGSLYPALKFALGEGKKIFFCTAKNTQQQMVYNTLAAFNIREINLSVTFLQAVKKMCINDVFFCHEDFCPYAKNYHERILESGILCQLLEKSMIPPDLIIETGREHKLCPAEIMLDLTLHSDVIVGDYNYVFDPAVFLRRIFNQKDYSDWILIIDEAHNLYQRGLDYYSPQLARSEIAELIQTLNQGRTKIEKELCHILNRIDATFDQMISDARAWHADQQYCPVSLDLSVWETHFAEFDTAFIRYLIQKVKKKKLIPDDPLEEFYYRFRRLVQIARLNEYIYKPYLNAEKDGILHIQCCDSSIPLGSRITGFHTVIAMSATLDPIGYYQNVLGFPPGDTEQLILDSPFPEEHKKVIIIPTVSTRFSRRDQYYPAFADIIRNIVKTRKGNYLVFFPSFDFMQNVNLFLGNVNCTRIIQQRQMSDANREEVLETLRHSETDHLLLAVMGGIFSEGVDYTGDMCIGVIIFSPGLPQVTYGRELIREYYDQERGNGFEYAYMYPGINKVIQAAGRLIRSHQDKGVVVLVGERFAQESVSSLLPEHWIRHPENLVITSDYVNELRKFWSKFA